MQIDPRHDDGRLIILAFRSAGLPHCQDATALRRGSRSGQSQEVGSDLLLEGRRALACARRAVPGAELTMES